MRLWAKYRHRVEVNTLVDSPPIVKGLAYWRNMLFSRILIYVLPISLIALVPGVVMSFRGGIPGLAVYDILTVISFGVVALIPALSLLLRKILFIFFSYGLSIVLFIYLGSFGPGLIYLLAVTVFITLIFEKPAGYWSIAINALICLFFAVAINFQLIDSPMASIYSLGSWIAVSSNVIFLSAVIVGSLQLLFNGLEATIVNENHLKTQLNKEKNAQEKMLDTLQTKNQELEQFAYISSHDLQEPLQAISSFTDLLKSQYQAKLDKRAGTYLEYLAQSTARMRALISGLLDYARIGREQQLEEVNCQGVVNEVLMTLDASIEQSGARVTVHPLPQVPGYPPELKQLFQNLLSNALKFRQEDVPLEIVIKAEDAGEEWVFSVQDNGIGIEERFQQKIFVIFQQLHPRSKYEGTGLGLAHSKKMVELHGGRIWVKSAPLTGSIFYFTIPKIPANDESQARLYSSGRR